MSRRISIYLPVASVWQRDTALGGASRGPGHVSDKEHWQRKQEGEEPRQTDQQSLSPTYTHVHTSDLLNILSRLITSN